MELIEKIEKSLQGPLPGPEAQYRMAHAARTSFPKPQREARIAAVLLLLFPKQEEWHTLFIQRVSSNPNDHHKGQIAFPGGMQEKSDRDLSHTALREAEEEVGLPTNGVEILGPLSTLYIPVSNFIVHPFVGKVNYTPEWMLQKSEVANIIETPLVYFRSPAAKSTTDISVSENLKLRNVPYFKLDGKILWGATAMMMNEFLALDW